MTDKADKKTVTEVKAYARGIHMSPQKVRLVFNMIKGLPVSRALTQLQFVLKRAALPVRKLVESAVANAKHNHEIEAERLFVKTVSVDGGQDYKRFQPRAQGRAFPIRRRTSHLNLILGVSDKPLVPKVKFAPKVAAPAAKPVEKPAAALPAEAEKDAAHAKQQREESRKGWRGWFGRKSAKTAYQGKKSTGFDRRGGE